MVTSSLPFTFEKTVFSFSLYFGLLISLGKCGDSVFWSNDPAHIRLQQLDDLLESRSLEKPLVLFILNQKFDLTDFSRLANVYSKDVGFLIPSLTKWISSSRGYSGEWISNNIEEMLSEIASSEILFYRGPENKPNIKGSALIVVEEDSLTSIDGKVEEVLSALGSRKFVALLTGKKQREHERTKRDTTDKTTDSGNATATYINGDSCLFYAREVWVTVEKQSGSDSLVHIKIDSGGKGSFKCTNNSAECETGDQCNSTFTIDYQGTWSDSGITVKKLSLEIVLKAESSGYWYLTNISVTQLEIQGKGTFNVTSKTDTGVNHLGIWSKRKMAYACWQTPTAYIKNRTKSEVTGETRIGISFNKFEVQPFGVEKGKFTDNVDDCVGFFSIGTWMGIFVGLLMVLILLFGIAMIARLKTVDRFDDPKGKPIQINTKE